MRPGQHAAPPSFAMLLTFPINLFALPLSFSLARFPPLSLFLRQDADKLSSRNTVSYPFNHPHFPFVLFISWPSVSTLTSLVSHGLQHFLSFFRSRTFLSEIRIDLWFLELLDTRLKSFKRDWCKDKYNWLVNNWEKIEFSLAQLKYLLNYCCSI